MSLNARNLERLGNQVHVPIEKDEDGYLGRECPVEECRGYFKITLGTGVKGPAPCHCPYCGHRGDQNTFWTHEQLEYAKSVVLRKVTDALHQDLKSLEFKHRPSGPFGIGISVTLQRGTPHPIKYYREKQLETEVVCDSCTLRYAIYGVFGWCPDCGIHNSFRILAKNVEFARKELVLAQSAEKDFADHLTGDALENVVSAFDGFGREICAQKGAEIQFQNLSGARRRVRDAFAFDFADVLNADQWDQVCRVFQKRHLLAHKMGVIDDDYIRKANDATAVVGRKITVSRDEVTAIIGLIELLGKWLFQSLPSPTL